MNIACPQCSTSYAISPEIIPASGMPVRCTRCDFAFSAFPDGRVESAAKVVSQGTTSTDGGPMLSDEALTSALTPPRTLTPVMGQSAPAPEPTQPKTSTQVMGQVGGAPAGFAEPKTSTQVMGQVSGAPAGFAEPKTSTQVMGQVGGVPAGFSEPKTSTQVMGQVSGVPAGFSEPKTSTQVMGQVGGAPTGFNEPKTSTQVMGQVSGVPAEAAPRSSTQVMGQAIPHPDAPAPRAVTQAMGQVAGAVAPQPRRSTQVMGQATPSGAAAGTPLMGTPHLERRSTLDFGLDTELSPSPRTTDELGAIQLDSPIASEGVQIRLPPEEGHAPPALLSTPFRDDPDEAYVPVSRAGSGRWRWVLLGLVVIAAGAFGFKQLTAPKELPPEAFAALEEVHRLILRDDAPSLAKAQTELEALVARHPDFIAARADQALVLALQIDDQRALADAHVAVQSRLRTQIAALERAQTPGDWRNRVNALQGGIEKHDQALTTIGEEETRLRGLLKETLAELPDASTTDAPERQRALARAQLFSLAITGSPEAMGMMERFRRAGGSEAWQTLAESTYLLHAPGVQPSDAKRLRERLAALKDQDASWMRVYLLDARLARTMGAAEAMRSNLEAVAVLNPDHALAKELRSLLQQR